jgi:hypothetical protein
MAGLETWEEAREAIGLDELKEGTILLANNIAPYVDRRMKGRRRRLPLLHHRNSGAANIVRK